MKRKIIAKLCLEVLNKLKVLILQYYISGDLEVGFVVNQTNRLLINEGEGGLD